jgi:hypothetical protein
MTAERGGDGELAGAGWNCPGSGYRPALAQRGGPAGPAAGLDALPDPFTQAL